MSLDDLSMLGAQVGLPAPPSVGAEIASLADAPAPPTQPSTLPKDMLLAPDGSTSARQRHLEFKAQVPAPQPRDILMARQSVTPRQANIMAAASYEDVAQAIRQDDDPIRTGARSVAFEVYSNRVPGAEAAQVDFARFDHAYEQGVIKDDRAVSLWSKMTSGQLLTEDETEELSSSVQTFAETLDGSPSDDLSIGLTGRVASVQRVADGLGAQVEHPLGWDDGRAADPAVRQERIAKINLSSLAEQGARNLSTIFALASERDLAPVEGDSLEPFVGVVLDLPESVNHTTVEEAYRDLAERSSRPVEDVKGLVRAGWESLVKDQAGSWGNGTPFALPDDSGANPIVDALMGRTEGPFSLQSAAVLRLPADALEATAGDGMSSLALPDGSVVYAAPINDDAASMARHLYPGVVGADRVPRWIPSTPMKVTDALRHRRTQDSDSHYDVFAATDLTGSGGHPLFKPGNYITFETVDDSPAPVPDGVAAQSLGRVIREVPGLSLERLTPNDLDPQKFLAAKDSPLVTHAWALFDSTGPDQTWVADLRRRGYPTIPTEDGFLVFGIGRDEAETVAEGRQVMVTTRAGGDGGPRKVRVGDQTVTLNPQEWIEDTPPPARKATVRRRMEVQVPKGTDPARLAQELELSGADNLAIYAHAKHLDGFGRAYETAYDDGIETIVVRHAKGDLAAAHGGPVFVKSTKGLPEGPGGAEMQPPPILGDDDPADLIPAVQAAHDAGTATVAGYDVVQPQGLKRPEEMVKDRNGIPVPRPRRDRPKPEWEEAFGVEFDPAWRVGNKVQELPADVQASLYRVFSSFKDDQSVARFSPSRVVVSFVDGDEPAQTEWKVGGAIVLNRDADPQALPAALRRELEAIRAEW